MHLSHTYRTCAALGVGVASSICYLVEIRCRHAIWPRVQRVVSLHRPFCAQHHGGGAVESSRKGAIPCFQRRESPARLGASAGHCNTDAQPPPVEGLGRKNWDEFAAPGAPQLDFVFTVCDHAAKEICPAWPGQPMTAHWGIEDPAGVEGTPEQQQRAFNLAFRALDARLRIFTSLRLESLDSLALQRKLDEIGRTPADEGQAARPESLHARP
jgi:arsenate reductase (thioredoxin)